MMFDNNRKLNILIIDDTELDRERIIRCIRKGLSNEVTFMEVNLLSKAHNLLKDNHFDCIILDHNLPDGSSEELLNHFKKNLINVPVIVVTGEGGERVVLSALKAGALDYINKDVINPDSISRSIRNTLEIQRGIIEKTILIEELRSFAGMVAHDLKSPLASIICGTDLIKDSEGCSKPELNDIINIISSSSQKMLVLINDLLSYSSVDGPVAKFTEIDLNHVLDDTCQNLQKEIKSSKAIIKYSSLPKINGLYSRLVQLFQNIISNAIKYSEPERTPIISIFVLSTSSTTLSIIIEDNGIGFDQKYAKEIFHPLKRLATKDQRNGTGIGLATCKRIVNILGGDISAESEENVGTKFLINLPLYQETT